jgi:1,2-diacylglycerol 3-beta-galactosyltransferase
LNSIGENYVADLKRILILTNDTGFGHRSAANAIAAALAESHCTGCVVEIVNPLDDERTPAFLRESQSDYDRLVREMPDRYKLRYEFSDAAVPNAIVESALTVMLFNILRDLFERFKPDVILTTHSMYTAPASAVISINRLNIPFLVVVTDLTNVHRMWFNNSADMILVPTRQARDQALELGLPEEQVQVTGIPVNPKVVKETRQAEEMRQELGWRADLKSVLVVGSKRVKGLEEVLHVFNHADLPMQLAVVAGGDDELYAWLKEYDWHIPAHLYNFVENMPALLRAADCVISKAGGLIVTEVLACGRPLLMVDITPGQEEGNAEYVVKNGAGVLAETPVKALEHLFHWLHDPALLAETQEQARSIGRPQAAFTVADLAWSAAERGPRLAMQESVPVLPRLLDLLASFGIRSGTGTEDEYQSL